MTNTPQPITTHTLYTLLDEENFFAFNLDAFLRRFVFNAFNIITFHC